jgi:hypothetical protein
VGVGLAVLVGAGVGVAVLVGAGVGVAVFVGVGVGVDDAGLPEVQVTELPSALRTHVIPEFVLAVGAGVGGAFGVRVDFGGAGGDAGWMTIGWVSTGFTVSLVAACGSAAAVAAAFDVAVAFAATVVFDAPPTARARARRSDVSLAWLTRAAGDSLAVPCWAAGPGVCSAGAEPGVTMDSTPAIAPLGPWATTMDVTAATAAARRRARHAPLTCLLPRRRDTLGSFGLGWFDPFRRPRHPTRLQIRSSP